MNEKVSVKCDGATDPFAIVCIAIRPGVAMWHGSASCPGVVRLDDALPVIACCDARHDKHAQFSYITAVTCPPLDVDNGKASSTSPSKVTETVDIACDDGYKKVGTSATCSPAGLGKAAWTNIPKCEGRLQGCLYEGTDELQVNDPTALLDCLSSVLPPPHMAPSSSLEITFCLHSAQRCLARPKRYQTVTKQMASLAQSEKEWQ